MELERSIWLISWIQILVYRSAVRGVSDFRNTLRQDEVGRNIPEIEPITMASWHTLVKF